MIDILGGGKETLDELNSDSIARKFSNVEDKLSSLEWNAYMKASLTKILIQSLAEDKELDESLKTDQVVCKDPCHYMIRWTQALLTSEGYEVGNTEGVYDEKTREAVLKYEDGVQTRNEFN